MELFYREFGDGPPMVILHGLYGSSDNWTGIARQLSQYFRVILPDQRNHGKSPHDPSHTYTDMSNDLNELVEKLGIGRFILAGHSMGGKTAVYFARRWPEKVAALVIVDMTPFRIEGEDPSRASMHREILEVMNRTDLSVFNSRDETDKIFEKTVGSERIAKFLLKNITRNSNGSFGWKLNPAYLRANLPYILDGFSRDIGTDDQITGFPVIFLKAENSDYINDAEVPAIMQLFPAATIIEVKGTSHWLHAERPEIFISTVRSLLE